MRGIMKKSGFDKGAWRRIGKASTETAGQGWQNPNLGEVGASGGGAGSGEAAVPGSAEQPRIVDVSEMSKGYEVNEMETSTITKTQTTTPPRGRYTNAPLTPGIARVDRKEVTEKDRAGAAARRPGRDLHSGMELLDLDFLLGVVENTAASEPQDIMMRRLAFEELIRTSRVHEVDSQSLKVYAVDTDRHFGKDIQVEAFKELTERTATGGHPQ